MEVNRMPKKHMLGCNEWEVCNFLYMHLKWNLKFNDSSVEIDSSMWKATDFDCTPKPVATKSENYTFMEKLFVNKPVAIDYNIMKNSFYKNLSLGKQGYSRYFGEDCVEWFISEMLKRRHMWKINSKLI